MSKSNGTSRPDLHAQITETILSTIEEDTGEWRFGCRRRRCSRRL
jgi:hypothetical protein